MGHVHRSWRPTPSGLHPGEALELRLNTWSTSTELKVIFVYSAEDRATADFRPNPPPPPPAPLAPQRVELSIRSKTFGKRRRIDLAASTLKKDGTSVPLRQATTKPPAGQYFALLLHCRAVNPTKLFIPCPAGTAANKAVKVAIDVEYSGSVPEDDFVTELLVRQMSIQEKMQRFLHAQSKLVYGPPVGISYQDYCRAFVVTTLWGPNRRNTWYNTSFRPGEYPACAVCSPFTGHFLSYWFNCHGRAAHRIHINGSAEDMTKQAQIFRQLIEPVTVTSGTTTTASLRFKQAYAVVKAAAVGDIFVCGSRGHTWLFARFGPGFSVQRRYVFGHDCDKPDELCANGVYKIHASFPGESSVHYPAVGMGFGYKKYLFDAAAAAAKAVLATPEYRTAHAKYVEPIEKQRAALTTERDKLRSQCLRAKAKGEPRKTIAEKRRGITEKTKAIKAANHRIADAKKAHYKVDWLTAEQNLRESREGVLLRKLRGHPNEAHVKQQVDAARAAGCDGVFMFASTPLTWMNAQVREAVDGEKLPDGRELIADELVYDHNDRGALSQTGNGGFRMWKLARVLDHATGWIDRTQLNAFHVRRGLPKDQLPGIERSDCRPMLYRRQEDLPFVPPAPAAPPAGTATVGAGSAATAPSSPPPTETITLGDLLRRVLELFPDF